MIWGVNTLFLLDAGLSITETFAANAFFTAGMVLFEVPTGIVADTIGRRASYLLGTATLFGATVLYLLLWQTSAPFAAWAVVSALLGLGFTFFSGATEAWLVDGLNATGYGGKLDGVFAKGQIVNGVAMLGGTIAGGVLAQVTNLGVPYAVRAALLLVTFAVAWRAMHDVGFAPKPRTSIGAGMRDILRASIDHGLGNPPVRWLMLAAPFTFGASIYGFYAVQPYLLELYGDSGSYAIAGISAALIGGTQIAGGAMASMLAKRFRNRTTIILLAAITTVVVVLLIGLVPKFGAVLALVAVWGILFSAVGPIRQAYLNGLIPSAQRATVLSSDSLLANAGGVIFQPSLGKAADAWGYPSSYLAGALVQLLAVPFILRARQRSAGAFAPATTTQSAVPVSAP
jgi:MFS family permease